MKIRHTNRGFEYIQFEDYYGETCVLQQSSLAMNDLPGSSAVWLGTGDNRMHLNKEQVDDLVAHLESWLETGSFDYEDRTDDEAE